MARYRKPPPPTIPDFDAFSRLLVETATKVAKVEIQKFAEDERKLFVSDIRAQRFQSFTDLKLSDFTILKKMRYHAPLSTMIATGEYLKSIQVFPGIMPQKGHVDFKPWKKPANTVFQLTIGIDQNQHARDLVTRRLRPDVLMQDVARIQEFGAPRARIPARPHWGPHFIALTKRAAKLRPSIARLVCKELRTKMQGTR